MEFVVVLKFQYTLEQAVLAGGQQEFLTPVVAGWFVKI